MSERPLVLSILIGLVVVLIIAGISLLVKMNALDDSYKKELGKSINLQKTIEELKNAHTALKEENAMLKEKNAQLTTQLEELETEIVRLEKLKNKLEENLKDELMKNQNLTTSED